MALDATPGSPMLIGLHRSGGRRTLIRCISYLQPYWTFVVGAYISLLASNGITIGMPLVIKSIVDGGIQGNDAAAVWRGTLILLSLALVRGVCTFLSGRWTEAASQSVAYDLRNAIHEKLQSLSFSYHDRAETGQLLARAIGDVDRIRFLTGRAFLRLIGVVVLIIGAGVSMIGMHPTLALLTLTIVPFLAYGGLTFGRRYRPLFRMIRGQMERLTTRLEQNLRGARIVKAFAQELAEVRRFDDENARVFELNVMGSRMRALYLPFMRLVASAGAILVLRYGGQLVIRDQLTMGDLIAFMTYVSQLVDPVRRLGWVIAAIAQAVASGERIFEILDTRSDVEDQPGAQPLGKVQGRVRFQHVSFAYLGQREVLGDIDFEAPPGEVVALLGMTGSGKSSVIRLIPRFYDPTEGQILVDERDIRRVTVNSLREHIGIVMQETTLRLPFARTLPLVVPRRPRSRSSPRPRLLQRTSSLWSSLNNTILRSGKEGSLFPGDKSSALPSPARSLWIRAS